MKQLRTLPVVAQTQPTAEEMQAQVDDVLQDYDDETNELPAKPVGVKPDRDVRYGPPIEPRPEVTTDEADQIVDRIMAGLTGMPHEQGAKFAASEYNDAWFANEPSGYLRKKLATSLISSFGRSFFANKAVWEKYSESA